MKKIRVKRFENVIDYDAEKKNYRDLCNGKVCKYSGYGDWKDKMKASIQAVDKSELEDFKHYLINEMRLHTNLVSSFLPTMLCFITAMISATNSIVTGTPVPGFVVILMVAIMTVLDVSRSDTRYRWDYYFYEDLIMIVSEVNEDMGRDNTSA